MYLILARPTVGTEPAILGYVSPRAEHARNLSAQGQTGPRDVFITVYGRKPVLEALTDPALIVDKVLIAEQAQGPTLQEILDAAAARDIPVQRVSAHRVKVLAGNGRHDQGVLADVLAPRMRPLVDAVARLPAAAAVLVLDAITNPANVGMILRTATAAGLDGVVLPRRGVPAITPLVLKSSAGVAFHAPVLRAATAEQACQVLRGAGFAVLGLTGTAPGAGSLFDDAPPRRVAYVLGNETSGISPAVAAALTGWVRIPMAGGVESLNVASAAAVVSFEWARRREARRTGTDAARSGANAPRSGTDDPRSGGGRRARNRRPGRRRAQG